MQRFLEDSDSFVVSLKLFQGVLECFGSLQKRPKPSWSAPEVSRNVSEHLLAGSWHPSRCPKASQSVRPGLCQWPPRDPGRVWKGFTTDPNAQMSAHSSPVKRPRTSQKSPRMSQSTLQRPGTLQMSQNVLECLTWPLPMASKISRMCLGRLYNGPDSRMSAHGSPVACFSLLHASASPCQNHSDHEHRQWRDPGHLKPSHPERNHNPNHKQGQRGICAILLMTCNLRHSWH